MKRIYTDKVRKIKFDKKKGFIQFGEVYETRPEEEEHAGDDVNSYWHEFFGDCIKDMKYLPKTNRIILKIDITTYNRDDIYCVKSLLEHMMKWNVKPLPEIVIRPFEIED